MKTAQFETIDLEQLEQVAGGGRIWKKIKKGVGNWAENVTDVILRDGEAKASHGPGGSYVTTEEADDLATEQALNPE
jgi:hypothetical protein